MERMKAWVYRPDREDGTGVYIFQEEVPIPEPSPGDLLLRVRKVSVCGTDEMLFQGHLRRALEGIIPGHEFCGEVVALGRGVRGFRIGQVVVGESHYSCPGCTSEGVIGLWPPLGADGRPGRPLHGSYAQYMLLPRECAHTLPEGLEEGRFWPSLFEPAGNDYLLAKEVVERLQGRRVGVFGCGPHGLYALLFLHFFGVERLLAFEVDPFRRDFARGMGLAEEVLDPGQDAEDQVRERLRGELFDVTVDMVGKSGTAFRQCCRLTRAGGSVVLFGLFDKEVQIEGQSANDLIFSRADLSFRFGDKPLRLLGVTGREGIWPELIATVAAHTRLQEALMKPVSVVGPLDLLGSDTRSPRVQGLKRAFLPFQCENGEAGIQADPIQEAKPT